jgi:hypothetical protein
VGRPLFDGQAFEFAPQFARALEALRAAGRAVAPAWRMRLGRTSGLRGATRGKVIFIGGNSCSMGAKKKQKGPGASLLPGLRPKRFGVR